eukprot:gene31827-40160_t
MDVVWIKRDARLHDHGPFAHVGARPFCVLYCYEPDQLAHHSVHGSHIGFINEGLQDLDNALHSLAGSSHARTSHAADGNLNPPTGEFTQDSAYQQLSSGEPCSIFRSVREPHSDKPGRLCGEHCGQVDAPQGESQGGAPLRRVSIWKGEITTALESLNASPSGPVVRLLSHEETGHLASYRRDKRVRRWCREARVEWREFAQTGVRRHSRSEEAKIGPGGLRDAWSKSWSTFIFSPQHPTISATAARKAFRVTPASIHGHKAAAAGDELSHRAVGNATLRTSESERSRGELLWTANSEPATVSGYEVDGCLYSGERADWTGRLVTAVELGLEHPEERSQRQHGGEERAHHVLDSFLAARGDGWLKSLQALRSRLQWRSHFMQKLECEPELECSNQCRSYDCLRTQEGDWNEALYVAWTSGRTGFPMVDACMRCLLGTGWVNFRMRAMLASFASYNLWLDWRRYGGHLARCFLDYEPGVHYPQLQMQSGTSGINAMRVYSVSKQGQDQDPQ